MTEQSFLLGLIGEGVRPSLTPPMHEAEGAAQGLRLVYRPIDLSQLNLPATDVHRLLYTAAELGFDALNITHPCKQLVLESLDELDPAVRRLGACNTVVIADGKLIGYNTDHSGFASALADELPGADLTDVILMGAGGAGSAVADALVQAGAQRLTIIDPQLERAQSVVAQLQAAFPEPRSVVFRTGSASDLHAWMPDATGVVNASPIGMFSHPGVPFDTALLHPDLWVADIVYRPSHTALIDAAKAIGCAVMPGGAMAVGQAADTFALVTGNTPDRARMRRHLDELIATEHHDESKERR